MNVFLCSYWDGVGSGHVTDNNIRYAVKFAAKALNYPERGISLDRINTHSLRSGGACVLALAGFKGREIVKNGPVVPEITRFNGVHPTAAVNILSWNVNRNDPSRQIHQYGRIGGQ